MRIFVEEGFLGVVGAFCVAAFTLGATWSVLEGVLGFGGTFAGLVAAAATVATMESISRRHYGTVAGSRTTRAAAAAARDPELSLISPVEALLRSAQAEPLDRRERDAAPRPPGDRARRSRAA